MRLLRYNDANDASDASGFVLTQFYGEAIPLYAILSHTWGVDTDEVTFEELVNNTGKDKLGYKKIQSCGEEARQRGLKYFWVDTCCTIQAHHRRQRPTKRVAYAAENGGRMYIAF